MQKDNVIRQIRIKPFGDSDMAALTNSRESVSIENEDGDETGRRELNMKKKLYILLTLLIMIIVSRFAVRIVDATVQIDGNFITLAMFLLVVNALIGYVSYRLYSAGDEHSRF